MIRLILRRAAGMIPTALGVATLVFLLIHMVPGDPVDLILGESAQTADREALRHALGLDLSLGRQYLNFLAGLARGSLGSSIVSGQEVSRLVAARLGATMELAMGAISFALGLALPLGVLAAVYRDSWIDRASVGFALLGVSMPNFWLGPLLIIVFAIELGWLPVSGTGTLSHLILPALTLGMAMAAILTRMTRASLIEVLGQDYLRTARSKGISPFSAIVKHGLANALSPVITIAGLQFGSLLAGAIITESIFAWPGLGRLTIEAINQRDYPLVQGCVLVIGLSFVVANTMADICHLLLDPKARER